MLSTIVFSPAPRCACQPQQPRGQPASGPSMSSQSVWRQRWLDSCPRSPGRHPVACPAAASVSVNLSEDQGTPVAVALRSGSVQLMEQVLHIEGRDFRLIVPQDVEAIMEMYIEAGQEERDPYWARPWPSAVALAALLLQRPELVAGKRVAELGAGLGLAGIAAAMAGATEVVLLDREPLSLQCALLSAASSGVRVDTGTAACGDAAGLCRAELFDWTAAYSGPKFDVLLACDVLYEDFSVDSVAQVVPQMVFTAAGRLILSDPAHRTEDNRNAFIEMIGRGKQGLAVDEEAEVLVAVSGGSTSEECGAPDVAVRLMHFNKNWTASTIGVAREQ